MLPDPLPREPLTAQCLQADAATADRVTALEQKRYQHRVPPSVFWGSVLLQDSGEEFIQPVHHWSGILIQSCCYHGILIYLKKRRKR